MTFGRFWVSECNDGGVKVGYEEYGAMDREVTYSFSKEDVEKLNTALVSIGLSGTLEEMLEAEFGIYLEKSDFTGFCKQNDIEYKLFVWIS